MCQPRCGFCLPSFPKLPGEDIQFGPPYPEHIRNGILGIIVQLGQVEISYSHCNRNLKPTTKTEFSSSICLWHLCAPSSDWKEPQQTTEEMAYHELGLSISAIRFHGQSCYAYELSWIGSLGHSWRNRTDSKCLLVVVMGAGLTAELAVFYCLRQNQIKAKTAEPNKNDTCSNNNEARSTAIILMTLLCIKFLFLMTRIIW